MGMKAQASADLPMLLAHAGWLRRFARALVADAATAEDLAQDTMLSALRRPAANRGRGWLATVARNLAVDHFRGTARRGRREEAAHQHLVGAGSVASPEELIGEAQIHRQVAETVARLEEPFRQTIVLRFYEGLSSAEIARRLGEPDGTIRWRLKEGLDRVRAELDAAYGNNRSAWQLALAPILRAPGGGAAAGSEVARIAPAAPTATAVSWALVVIVVAAAAVAVGVTLGIVRRFPASHSRGTAAELAIPGPRSDQQVALSPGPVTRLALPSADPYLAAPAASLPASTPTRGDAQSLAEELLAAVEGSDYDAFVAKGSPSFRAAASRARLDAASAALAGRLSAGRRVSALGNVRRARTVDWFFKLEFDDGGDDAVCTLAMDGWQVAGFVVTDPIPNLGETR